MSLFASSASASASAAAAATEPTARPKRRLENLLNDLSWKEWLLYQKSFFHVSDDQSLFGGIVGFFTKAQKVDGSPSRVLTLSIDGAPPLFGSVGRSVVRESTSGDALGAWSFKEKSSEAFNLIIVDLRPLRASSANVAGLRSALRSFYETCRKLLLPASFCVVLSCETEAENGRFPLPWLLATAARSSFRLRDEKIGIQDDANGEVLYLTVLQAVDEIGERLAEPSSADLAVGKPALPTRWIKPRPRPRRKSELLHPAKFPEELINFFLSAFTEPGDTLLDPMGGTASVGVAGLQAGRVPVIIELDNKWAVICRERMKASGNLFGGNQSPGVLIEGDARDVLQLVPENLLPVRYTITSPPYWRILHSNGMHVNDEGQKARRAKGLATVYSDNERDFGNITSYERFVEELAAIYEDVARLMPRGSLLTFVTKNIKYERAIYTIAWDLVFRLCRKNGGKFEYAGNTFWCQDDVGLKPFGMGCDWISNILHQYCIHMRVR